MELEVIYILAWMDSFPHGHSQQFVLDGVKSLASEVSSGVPQESLLGPTVQGRRNRGGYSPPTFH